MMKFEQLLLRIPSISLLKKKKRISPSAIVTASLPLYVSSLLSSEQALVQEVPYN